MVHQNSYDADDSRYDDLNDIDNIDDDIEGDSIEDIDDEQISDLPQELTESYGTGIHDQPGFSAGGRTMRARNRSFNEATPELTGGDIDANWEQANHVGDESVGGTVSTPDMDVVEELGVAVGLEMDDRAFLRTNDILEERDSRRWELQPDSSEDYRDRREDRADQGG